MWRPASEAPDKITIAVVMTGAGPQLAEYHPEASRMPLHPDLEPGRGYEWDEHEGVYLCPPGWYAVPHYFDDEEPYWDLTSVVTHWWPIPPKP